MLLALEAEGADAVESPGRTAPSVPTPGGGEGDAEPRELEPVDDDDVVDATAVAFFVLVGDGVDDGADDPAEASLGDAIRIHPRGRPREAVREPLDRGERFRERP